MFGLTAPFRALHRCYRLRHVGHHYITLRHVTLHYATCSSLCSGGRVDADGGGLKTLRASGF